MKMDNSQPAIIKVIGVGGGGNNAIDRMISEGITGVDFIGINTDVQVLRDCKAPRLIQIGEKVSGGKGVGMNPELGRQAAEEDIDQIKSAIAGADMVIITTGMGGGTGTGAAPIVARTAKEANCLTVGVVTMPFQFEGREKIAEGGLENIRLWTDSMIVISNDKVLPILHIEDDVEDMYKIIDRVLWQCVQGITDIITRKGVINRDFNDVRVVLKDSGTAIIGMGECSNKEDPIIAIEKAVNNPMFEKYDILKATKLLINIVTSSKTKATKYKEILDAVNTLRVPNGGPLFVGHAYEERLDERIRIVIIGSGFRSMHGSSRRVSRIRQSEKGREDIIDATTRQQDLFVSDKETNEKISFDKPAYDVWTQTGRLEKK